jgi:hypothetical protein
VGTAKAPLGVRLIIRASLTAIFAVAALLAFAVGRPVVGFVALGFLVVSIALLVVLLHERKVVGL